jgi:hypothetical protein
MEHRGVEYSVVQGVERGVWKWSASVADMLIMGQAPTRSAAVAAVERAPSQGACANKEAACPARTRRLTDALAMAPAPRRKRAIQDCSIGPALMLRLQRKIAIWSRREDAVGVGTMESSMSKAGLDNRHRNHDGEISHKHGNTLIGTLRKIYGQSFAAGYPATEKLSEILLELNETSLSQLRRDHETGHLEHKIVIASK